MKRRINRKPSTQAYLSVPTKMSRTPRKAAEKLTVFKHGQFPIGDLYHARLALIYVLPHNINKDLTAYVVGSVQQAWPMYKWNQWWNKRRKEPKSTWGVYLNRYKKLEESKKKLKKNSSNKAKINPRSEQRMKKNPNSPFHQYMSIAKLKSMRKIESNAKKLSYRLFELNRIIADDIRKKGKVTAAHKKKHPRIFGEKERIEAWLKEYRATKKTKKKTTTKRKTVAKRKTTAKKKTTTAKKKSSGKLTLKEIEAKARTYNRGSKVGKYQKLVGKHGKMNAKRILSKAKKLQK